MKMGMMYGHKWVSISEADDGTWLTGLCGISPDQVAKGLSRLVDEFHQWPPSLPEFKRLCLGIDENELMEYIKKYALKGYDTFSKNQMTYKQIDALVDRARDRATTEYMTNIERKSIEQNIERLQITRP